MTMISVAMWTKDASIALGEETFRTILYRIDRILPQGFTIIEKIAIDDNSRDSTREILKEYGWKVILNPYGGIATAFNIAMRKATSKIVFCIEQDILLTKEWLEEIAKYVDLLNHRSVMALQGLNRIICPSMSISVLEELKQYVFLYYNYPLPNINNTFIDRDKALKNNLWIPLTLKYGAVDGYAYIWSISKGLKWIIIPKAKALHLWTNINISRYIKKYRQYGKMVRILKTNLMPNSGRKAFPNLATRIKRTITLMKYLMRSKRYAIPSLIEYFITIAIHS